MYEWLITGAIVSLIIVSALHSGIGEKLLLGPMFEHRGNHVLENGFARFVLRGGWHLLSLMWLVMAVILYALAFHPDNLALIILRIMAGSFLSAGIFDLILSKGKHIGWPVLTAIGIFCAVAAEIGL